MDRGHVEPAQRMHLRVTCPMTATIGVCGFGRCGSTMVMHMLDRGGVPPAPGAASGSYEMTLATIPDLTVENAGGCAVKVLDIWREVKLPPLEWRFVWLDRDTTQQALSTRKLLEWSGMPLDPWADRDMVRRLKFDRPRVLAALRGIAPVTVLEYERVLANPTRAVRTLAGLVPEGISFDRRAAAAAVHHRSSACRPDMHVEDALVGKPR